MEKQKQKIKLIVQRSNEEVDIGAFIEDIMSFDETETKNKILTIEK
jgi:hypothetical protein